MPIEIGVKTDSGVTPAANQLSGAEVNAIKAFADAFEEGRVDPIALTETTLTVNAGTIVANDTSIEMQHADFENNPAFITINPGSVQIGGPTGDVTLRVDNVTNDYSFQLPNRNVDQAFWDSLSNLPAVVNTLSQTTPGSVLDARQGKALYDLIQAITFNLFLNSDQFSGDGKTSGTALNIDAEKETIRFANYLKSLPGWSSNTSVALLGNLTWATVGSTPMAVINFGTLSPVNADAANFTLGATSSNAVTPITYTSSNPSVASISGNVVDVLTAGTTNITASQAAGNGYTAATDVVRQLTVNAVATQLSSPVMNTPTIVSSSALTPNWSNVANETNYSLERSLNGSTGWAVINSPAANATSFADTGLTAATLYYYRMKAIGNGSTYTDSPYSNIVSATTSAASGTGIQDINITSNNVTESPAKTYTANSGGITVTSDTPIVIGAGKEYRLYMDYVGASTESVFLGIASGIYVAVQTNFKAFESGGHDSGTAPSGTGADQLGIHIFPNGSVKAEYRLNGSSTWVSFYDFTGTLSGTVNPNAYISDQGNKLINPKLQTIS